jgi:luciferase family oxidoreductase group 1
MPLRLSVLDQSPIAAGLTAADAVEATIALAQTADAHGYHRFWVAEHHATPMLAGCAPEVLIGPIARATSRIRVGSGGIMLPHYSPFKVAESFRLLSALAPGRIDLGLGRAPGTDGLTAFALQRDRNHRMPDDFPRQLAELLAYLDDKLPPDHAFAGLPRTLPTGGGGSPDPWLLGSSEDSAYWAAEAGLPYCVADFINPRGAPLARIYRDNFRPSMRLAEPYVMVCLWALAAESEEDARRLAAPAKMVNHHFVRGQLIAVPSTEEAVAWLERNAPDKPAGLPEGRRRRMIRGTPQAVREGIEAAAAEYRADEVMLVNIMSDQPARRHGYALVADAFALASGPVAA